MLWILNILKGRYGYRLVSPTGLRRAAGLIIAFSTLLILPMVVFAQGPPVTDPNNDARCADIPENIPENVFFLNVFTPANGVVGPGSLIGAWYSDETMPNTNPAPIFVLTGPNTNASLTASQEPFSMTANERHKECRHQVNMTTTIPATASGGGAYAPGDYTVTLTAYDGDEAPDKGTHVWRFTVTTPPPTPSPSPTAAVSPASSPGSSPGPGPSSGSSPTGQVQAASTTGPGLPSAGHPDGNGGLDRVIGIGQVLTLVGLVGFAISRRVRRPS